MSWFRREFATYVKTEIVIFSEPFGLLGSNFQNKLVYLYPSLFAAYPPCDNISLCEFF